MALIADIVYGAPTSFRDLATYRFAHGGKDTYPFPIDRAVYDHSIEKLATAVSRARLDETVRRRRLSRRQSHARTTGRAARPPVSDTSRHSARTDIDRGQLPKELEPQLKEEPRGMA